MLKGIPKIISPELLKILCEMGHGDCIVLADGNFPCESVGANSIVVRADGHGVPELLDAILELMPLDRSVEKPATLMAVTSGDNVETPIWDEFSAIITDHDDRGADTVTTIDRFSFYVESSKAYCIIATGESALYANIILQKGVVQS